MRGVGDREGRERNESNIQDRGQEIGEQNLKHSRKWLRIETSVGNG